MGQDLSSIVVARPAAGHTRHDMALQTIPRSVISLKASQSGGVSDIVALWIAFLQNLVSRPRS